MAAPSFYSPDRAEREASNRVYFSICHYQSKAVKRGPGSANTSSIRMSLSYRIEENALCDIGAENSYDPGTDPSVMNS